MSIKVSLNNTTIKAAKRKLLEIMGKAAVSRTKKFITSKTLRNALDFRLTLSRGIIRMNIPHYWAEYVHNGFGPLGPKRKGYYIYFRDKRLDPRTKGGSAYPVRKSDRRSLTKEEYAKFNRINARLRQAGLPPVMYRVKATKRAVAGQEFYTRAVERGILSEVYDKVSKRVLDDLLLEEVPIVKETAKVRL
jgi:hypothetical protein